MFFSTYAHLIDRPFPTATNSASYSRRDRK